MTEIKQYVLLRHRDVPGLDQLDVYRQEGGFAAFQQAVTAMQPGQVTDVVKASGLRGRGGAGFPTGMKWSFIDNNNWPHYVVANADESEPGTFKDRELMEKNPFQFLEGLAICCYAVQANAAYVYLRGEFWQQAHFLDAKIAEMEAAGLLGEHLFGTEYSLRIYTHLGAGAYICGEETALLESLEGKKGQPRYKPPFPASYGLYGRPTTINNTESFSSVPSIIRNGGEWFASLGVANAGGTKIFAVSGHVEKPGNFEISMGTPFVELLAMAGGVWKGRQLKAVIPGGSSVPVVPGDLMLKANMDYDSVSKVTGSMLGSGAVIVMDETTDMVKTLQRISRFYFSESCGQCTPCREGTGWLYRLVTRIVEGKGRPEDLDLLDSVASKIEGRTICALGDAAAMPVRSFVKHYRHEFAYYIEHKRSMVAGAAQAA